MGSMGSGIFDNDAALDILDEAIELPLGEIEGFVESGEAAVEHVDAVAACVAIHLALIRGCGASPPSARLAAKLHDKMLRVFDDRFDALRPRQGHKEARRAELAALLKAYREIAE